MPGPKAILSHAKKRSYSVRPIQPVRRSQGKVRCELAKFHAAGKKSQGLVTRRLASQERRGLGAPNHHRREERWMRETRICHPVQRERRHAKHAVDFPLRSCTPLSDTENVSYNSAILVECTDQLKTSCRASGILESIPGRRDRASLLNLCTTSIRRGPRAEARHKRRPQRRRVQLCNAAR